VYCVLLKTPLFDQLEQQISVVGDDVEMLTKIGFAGVTFVESIGLDKELDALETQRGRLVELGHRMSSDRIVVVVVIVDSVEGDVGGFVVGSVDGAVAGFG
jgi:hypothetical protein